MENQSQTAKVGVNYHVLYNMYMYMQLTSNINVTTARDHLQVLKRHRRDLANGNTF